MVYFTMPDQHSITSMVYDRGKLLIYPVLVAPRSQGLKLKIMPHTLQNVVLEDSTSN